MTCKLDLSSIEEELSHNLTGVTVLLVRFCRVCPPLLMLLLRFYFLCIRCAVRCLLGVARQVDMKIAREDILEHFKVFGEVTAIRYPGFFGQ